MDYSFQVFLLSGMAGVAMSFPIILKGEVRSCEVGTVCVLECIWEHDSGSAVSQYVVWKARGKGIMQNTRSSTADTFTYENSPIPALRVSETTDWIGEEGSDKKIRQTSILTVHNFSLRYPENYTCEVGIGRMQMSTRIRVIAYVVPSVSMEDIVVGVDLRAPIVIPTEEVLPEDAEADDRGEEEKYLEVSCLIEDAYPKPSRVDFEVGENEYFAPTSPVEWTQDPDTKLYSARARLRLKADPEYNERAVSCSTWLPTKPTPFEIPSSNTSSTFVVYHETTIVSTVISPEVVNEGETVVIECRGNGNPRPIFKIKSDVEVFFEVDDSGEEFTISSVLRLDAGTYWCEAELEDRRDPGATTYVESSNKPTLQVYYNDEPTVDSPSFVDTRKGASLDITCTGSGEPTPAVSWKKNGDNFQSFGSLRISKLDYSDSGLYECISENAAGTTKKSVEVQVQGACEIDFKKPYIANSMTTSGAYLVRLECIAIGKPECDVRIVRPTDIEVEGTTKAIAHGSILEFEAMPKLSSPVTFTCIAKNSLTPSNFNKRVKIDADTDACCEPPKASSIGIGGIVGIILLALVVVIGISLACYFVRKKNANAR